MRTIGLIGGMSWESSAQYYRLINEEVRARLGPLRSARLLMASVDFGDVEPLQRAHRWDEAGALLAGEARRLAAGGAECVVLCTNTMHEVADRIEAAAGLPLLHIADPAGAAARAAGARTVGLLGTAFTMDRDFYRRRLESRHGLRVIVPGADDRAEVHRVIYEELCAGRVEAASRERYRAAMARLVDAGAQAILLACTEIMLLVGPGDAAVPVLDTTALHARAAVDFALGG